jgi:hypothetical protein
MPKPAAGGHFLMVLRYIDTRVITIEQRSYSFLVVKQGVYDYHLF